MSVAIRAENLSKTYGDTRAVDGVSLEVSTGEFFGILGPNGAGKTTTLEIIEGLRRPDSGEVELLGTSPWHRDAAEARRIGVQFQASAFFERLTAREQIRTFAALYGLGPAPADAWLERVALTHKADTRTEDLSGGQLQRLAIACALLHEPELVFLDEPTAALDVQARRNLWDLLRSLNEAGRTVVLTTHHMDEAEALCDRVAIMDHGRILVNDRPSNLVRDSDAPVRVLLAPGSLSAADAGSLTGVDGVSQDHGALQLTTHAPSALITQLAELDALEGLQVRGANLEDVFLSLTGREYKSVKAFTGVAIALVKGFVRDRSSVFFSLVFPLMFLLLFGTIFDSSSSVKLDLVRVGEVAILEGLEGAAADAFEESFDVRSTEDRAEALDEVREGEADVAVEMDGETLVVHYSEADQVRAGIVQGTLSAFVDGANQVASGVPPRFTFRAESVEDDSIEPIQYFTPGLLGWAVAMSAAFGAAATLQGWRQSKLMRRLQLSPAPAAAVVSARVVVTIGIALVQMAIFLGLGTAVFGLRLEDSWWLAVPLLVAGTLSFMALGLLAGALSKTQEGAVNLANFFVLPMAFLSGSFFVLDGAPGWLQTASLVMPLRHLNDGMMDLMVRGEGVASMLAPMTYIIVFGLVVGIVAALLFRRTAE